MNRRGLIKNIIGIGIFGILPKVDIAESNEIKCYVGLGGGGSNVVEGISKKIKDGKFYFINDYLSNTHMMDFNRSNIPKYMPPSNDFLLEKKELTCSIQSIFNNPFASYFIYTGLGGKTGSLLALQIVNYLDSKKIKYKLIYSMPFNYEGKARNLIANTVHQELKENKNAVLLDFNQCRKEHGHILASAFFKKADQLMYELSLKSGL